MNAAENEIQNDCIWLLYFHYETNFLVKICSFDIQFLVDGNMNFSISFSVEFDITLSLLSMIPSKNLYFYS